MRKAPPLGARKLPSKVHESLKAEVFVQKPLAALLTQMHSKCKERLELRAKCVSYPAALASRRHGGNVGFNAAKLFLPVAVTAPDPSRVHDHDPSVARDRFKLPAKSTSEM
jgi:hypothetical protein